MNKKALALGVVGILTYSVPAMPTKAVSNTYTQNLSDDSQARTAGIISRCYITASASSGNLCLNGTTQSNDTVKSIGYKDISIEYSSDGISWNEEEADCLNMTESISVSVKVTRRLPQTRPRIWIITILLFTVSQENLRVRGLPRVMFILRLGCH